MTEGNVLSELPDQLEIYVTRWRDAQKDTYLTGIRVTAGDSLTRERLARYLEVLAHDVREDSRPWIEMVVTLDRSHL